MGRHSKALQHMPAGAPDETQNACCSTFVASAGRPEMARRGPTRPDAATRARAGPGRAEPRRRRAGRLLPRARRDVQMPPASRVLARSRLQIWAYLYSCEGLEGLRARPRRALEPRGERKRNRLIIRSASRAAGAAAAAAAAAVAACARRSVWPKRLEIPENPVGWPAGAGARQRPPDSCSAAREFVAPSSCCWMWSAPAGRPADRDWPAPAPRASHSLQRAPFPRCPRGGRLLIGSPAQLPGRPVVFASDPRPGPLVSGARSWFEVIIGSAGAGPTFCSQMSCHASAAGWLAMQIWRRTSEPLLLGGRAVGRPAGNLEAAAARWCSLSRLASSAAHQGASGAFRSAGPAPGPAPRGQIMKRTGARPPVLLRRREQLI